MVAYVVDVVGCPEAQRRRLVEVLVTIVADSVGAVMHMRR